MRVILLATFLSFFYQGFALNYKIIWLEPVDSETDERAHVWLDSLVSASYRINGHYPDTLIFRLRQVDALEDGCGWAYVKYPKKIEGVYMDVNVHVPLDTILSNWEPPHEICHMALPFLGKENKWLSEGFATYLSRHVMLGLGIYDDITLAEFYHRTFSEVEEYYLRDEPFEDVAKEYVEDRQYSAFYRGGAMYFYVCDYFIQQKKDLRLRDIIYQYQSTHKKTDIGFEMILESLDGLIGEPIMRKTLYFFKITPARAIINFVLTH